MKAPIRIIIKTIVLFLFCSFLPSCTITKAMWNRHYDDSTDSFVIDKNRKQVIFLGERFNYAFYDRLGIMTSLLEWDTRKILYLDFMNSQINVDGSNNISGYINIRSIFNKLELQDEAFLKGIGFRPGEYEMLELKIRIEGRRFPASYFPPLQSSLLNQRYYFEVKVPPNAAQKAGFTILTPFTMVLDSIIWVGRNILLAPFGMRD